MCSQSDIDLATCHIGPTRSTIQDPMFTHPGLYLPEESKLSLPVCITGLAQDYISMAGSTPSFCLPGPGQPAKPNVTGLLDRGSRVPAGPRDRRRAT